MLCLRHSQCGNRTGSLTTAITRTAFPRLISTGSEQPNSAMPVTVVDGHRIDEFQMDTSLGFKSTTELLRGLFVFKVSSTQFIIKHGRQIFHLAGKSLIAPVVNPIMQNTFYKHFCAGGDLENARLCSEKLKAANIKCMLYVPLEISANDGESCASGEDELDRNALLFHKYADMAVDLSNGQFVQSKITALCDMDTLLEMNEHLSAYETNHNEPFEWSIDRLSRLLENDDVEGITISSLSAESNIKLRSAIRRLDGLAKVFSENNLLLMVDAEQSYIQAAIGYLILLMQAKYNKDKPVVYNTYQCYRKDTCDRIKADAALGERLGFKVAGKAVRGAYMIEERHRAKALSLSDPINESYEATSMMYDRCVTNMLSLVKEQKAGCMVACHNENSIANAMNRMKDMRLSPAEQHISFGQLLGFADHSTQRLGRMGYTVYKSTPYGALDDTLLYLARRAQENQSAIARSTIEVEVIKEELKLRLSRALGMSY